MTRTEAIERLLHPKSVAIVGVSKDFSSISGKPLKNLLEHHYSGDIYPVNPKYDSIGGLTCYDSVLEIPGEVDVALLAVSALRILSILDECEQKGIRSLILFGSGFAEVGEEGKALQEKVEQKAKQANLSLLGPNCLGLLNVKDSLPLGFATSFETEKGFISATSDLRHKAGRLDSRCLASPKSKASGSPTSLIQAIKWTLIRSILWTIYSMTVIQTSLLATWKAFQMEKRSLHLLRKQKKNRSLCLL